MEILLPKNVDFILNKLFEKGFEAFIVGGCVRDCLLNKAPTDWDITTNGKPQDIIDIFEHTAPTGIKHGTITVIIDKEHYEVTTYRIDGEYSDNRHPKEVVFTSSLQEDLSRRDFTINAMAYNRQEGLIDVFNGNSDLENKIIKAVGNPDLRFEEDALRMLRAVRFACQLDFKIETKTFNSIIKNSQLIKKISKERIKDEFCKILLSEIPSKGIRNLENTNLLHYIIPELERSIGFNQKNPHHDKNVFDHIMSVLDYTPKNLSLRLAGLFHDIGKPKCFTVDKKGIGHFYKHDIISSEMAEVILTRLRFDNYTIKKVCLLIREHMSHYGLIKTGAIKKFISRIGKENLDDLFELITADTKGHKPPHDFNKLEKIKEMTREVLEKNEPLAVRDLKIKGTDLIEVGFKEGKDLGKILYFLLDKVLVKPELNTKEQLLKLALDNFPK